MQRIADALGVTRAAFYYHYASKQDLLRALAEPLVAAFEALADRAEHEHFDEDRLLRGYVDVLLAHERVLRFVVNDPAVQADAEVGVRLRDAYAGITAALVAGGPGPEHEIRAACALGAVSAGVLHPVAPADRRRVILDAAESVLGVAGRR
jgi:AcrR family transcriptional regulator